MDHDALTAAAAARLLRRHLVVADTRMSSCGNLLSLVQVFQSERRYAVRRLAGSANGVLPPACRAFPAYWPKHPPTHRPSRRTAPARQAQPVRCHRRSLPHRWPTATAPAPRRCWRLRRSWPPAGGRHAAPGTLRPSPRPSRWCTPSPPVDTGQSADGGRVCVCGGVSIRAVGLSCF